MFGGGGNRKNADHRFKDKDAALARAIQRQAPENWTHKVDMRKVNRKVVEDWVTRNVRLILGFEDEIVERLAVSMLDAPSPDPVAIQAELQGFLDKEAGPFVRQLWDLLLSAQEEPTGLPRSLLDARRAETAARVAELDASTAQLRARLGPHFVAGSQTSRVYALGDMASSRGGGSGPAPTTVARSLGEPSAPQAPPSDDAIAAALARVESMLGSKPQAPDDRASRAPPPPPLQRLPPAEQIKEDDDVDLFVPERTLRADRDRGAGRSDSNRP